MTTAQPPAHPSSSTPAPATEGPVRADGAPALSTHFAVLADDAGCTLPTAERPVRLAEFDDLFAEHARVVDPVNPDTTVDTVDTVDTVEIVEIVARIHLSGPDGLAERVRDLVARESACCTFFTFGVDGTDREPILTVAAPPKRRAVASALVDRARAVLR